MLSFLVNKGGRRMSEERVQVLAMLVTGKITIDQANQLLEVLGEEPLSEPERWTSRGWKQDEGWREPVREFQGRTAAQRMPSFTFDQIIELSEHEVDPAYFIKFREAGLTDLDVEQIIELSDHEVKPAYVKALREAGLVDLSFDQVIELSEREVDPAYVRALHGEIH